jgi:hypothetical protein
VIVTVTVTITVRTTENRKPPPLQGTLERFTISLSNPDGCAL